MRERYTGNPGEALADEATSWLYLLAEGYKRPEEVERMAEEFPTIEEFARQYGIAIGDPGLKRQYEKFYESTLEYNTAMHIARDEGVSEGMAKGLEQGMEQGREQGRESIVSYLRGRGVDETLLAEALEAAAAERA